MTVSTHSFNSCESTIGLAKPLSSFEAERFGHHGNGERIEFGGEAGDDRRGASAGASPKSGGDKDHVGAFERFNDLVGVFKRSLAADIRIGAGPKALGELAPI